MVHANRGNGARRRSPDARDELRLSQLRHSRVSQARRLSLKLCSGGGGAASVDASDRGRCCPRSLGYPNLARPGARGLQALRAGQSGSVANLRLPQATRRRCGAALAGLPSAARNRRSATDMVRCARVFTPPLTPPHQGEGKPRPLSVKPRKEFRKTSSTAPRPEPSWCNLCLQILMLVPGSGRHNASNSQQGHCSCKRGPYWPARARVADLEGEPCRAGISALTAFAAWPTARR